MPEAVSEGLKISGDFLLTLWKYLVAITGLCAFLWGFWIQIWGAGIVPGLQNTLGITEVLNRLDYIEQYMPAPRVVEWNESAMFQDGECSKARCVYILNGARTPFGETCGDPVSVEPFFSSSSGQISQVSLHPDYKPPVLDRTPKSFPISFEIPYHLKPGNYQWRARVVYETCIGNREPLPRWTPWRSIIIY